MSDATIARRIARSAVLSLILIAGSIATAAAADKVIRFVPQADPGVLDPVVNSSYIGQEHGYMVYDTLFSFDEKYIPQPEMVERYAVSADGLTYTFTLRGGMKFTDGSVVRAEDAVASIKRWAPRDTNGRKMVELGMTLTIVDDRTFTLTLREKWGSVLDSMAKIAGSALFVMRARDAETPPTTAISEIVGSGPFRFVKPDYVPASLLAYERNPGYASRPEPSSFYAGGKRVAVDRVEWRIMPDPATATAALGAGEVDVYETPPLELLVSLRNNPNVVVAVHNTLGAMAYYRPNFLYPPFDNVKARQALLYLADQADYMQAAIGSDPSTWRVCWAWLACGSPGGTEAGADAFRKSDPAKAKALFREAGYKGEKLIMMQPTDQPVLRAVTEVAVQRMKEIGLNLDVQAMNWGTLVGRRAKQDPPDAGGWNLFFTWTFGLDLANPLANAALAAPCDRKNYPGWPCDAEIERLRDAWGKASDPVERQKVATQIQERSVAYVPYAPVGQYTQPIAYRSSLKNFLKVPLPVMWNVEKTQ